MAHRSMRRRVAFGTLGLGLTVSVLAAPSVAASRDPFVGEWSGDCGPKVQCWLDVAKKSKNYPVRFIVADRMDAKKVRCEVAGHMTRGPVRYAPQESYDDGLTGNLSGSITYVAVLEGGSSVIVGGGLTAGLACGKYIMQQVYYPIGW